MYNYESTANLVMKIYTLTLSPAYDLHASAESIELGKENLIRRVSREVGGKGINISRALLAYGIGSVATVLVGENSEELEEELSRLGIATEYVRCGGRIRENLTIHTPNGETRLSYPPEKVNPDVLAKIRERLHPNVGDIVTLSGRVPDGIDIPSLVDYMASLRECGVRTVIDSRSFKLEDILKMKPWLIKPNREEIMQYSEKEALLQSEIPKIAKTLSQNGVENVVITLDSDGAILASKGKITRVDAPKIEPLSTIGAGDSAIAGFIAAAAQKKRASEALIYAVAFGTAACLADGTEPPKEEVVNKFIMQIKEKENGKEKEEC